MKMALAKWHSSKCDVRAGAAGRGGKDIRLADSGCPSEGQEKVWHLLSGYLASLLEVGSGFLSGVSPAGLR